MYITSSPRIREGDNKEKRQSGRKERREKGQKEGRKKRGKEKGFSHKAKTKTKILIGTLSLPLALKIEEIYHEQKVLTLIIFQLNP